MIGRCGFVGSGGRNVIACIKVIFSLFEKQTKGIQFIFSQQLMCIFPAAHNKPEISILMGTNFSI